MSKLVEKVVFVCTLLAVLTCYLPLAPFCGSAIPHAATHGEMSDILSHAGSLLPQEWGLRKTTITAVRSLLSSLLYAGLSIQNKPVSESWADGVLAAIDTKQAASGHTYLNNLSLRC
jgi:hypothetical protein